LNPSAPILLIIAAVAGFTTGAYLDGEVSPHSFRIPIQIMDYTDGTSMSIFQTAEMSGKVQTIIDHAIIDFNIAQVPDGEFFRNVVDECIFRSDESFKPLCIKCEFKNQWNKVIATGEKIELMSSYEAPKQIHIGMEPVPKMINGKPAFIDVQNVKNVQISICGVKDKCPDDHDKCKCDERKKDHKKHYDDFDKYYKDNKKKFGKAEYSKYMNDYEDYLNENGKYMDSSDFKMFMNYHEKFLKDNKNYFSSNDYNHYSEEHKKYSKDYPKHDDDDDDDNDNECKEKSGFFVGGGKVYVPKNGNIKSFTLTHGFELHCDATQAPNNLEINWMKNKFHLEQLVKATCIDDGSPNEPPPSPHPGPTLDVYKGEGYGRYNGVCGAYATWEMDDNGEPGKKDQIINLEIKNKKNGDMVLLNIGNTPLSLQTGNHQFVPHPSTHPNPPTQTTPCPQMTP